MTSTRTEAAAAVSIGAGLALRKRNELLGLLLPCSARTEPWLQELLGQVRVGAGQRASPGQRVEHRPAWPGPDAGPGPAAAESRGLGHPAAMSVVRRFAVKGLEEAAARRRGRAGW